METAESLPSGSVAPAPEATATVQGSAIYHPASEVGSENPSHGESVTPVAVPPPAVLAAPGVVSLALVGPVKKKRGRPRKYGPDGSLLAPLESASAPSRRKYSAVRMRRGGGRPLDFARSSQTWFEMESLGPAGYERTDSTAGPAGYERTENISARKHFHVNGDMIACFAGANFTPHVITVAAGEDVTVKIISFSQQGPRAICILSANGVISNVTLRQADSSGGTLTYEGRFELLSLSGSFLPTDNGGTRSRHGGMSVSLASPDRRVIGGSVAGLLVAASPVQVVVGSFIPGYQMEQTTPTPKHETTFLSSTVAGLPISTIDAEVTYEVGQVQQRSSVTTKPILTASTSFRGENWTSSALHSVQETRNSTTDISLALQSG